MKINTACWVNGCKCFNPNDEDGVWIKKDRDWVGLTEDDLVNTLWPVTLIDVVRLVEAKLKEKNT